MKKILATALLAGCSTPLFGQGLVNFLNNATTLVSVSGTAIQGPPGTYYFALLTAPVGTTDPALFTFSGAYGTNQATAGRFSGGVRVAIANWRAGQTRAFMVAGWSVSFGHDWNPNWLTSWPSSAFGEFGFSAIAEGAAGGFDGTANIPYLSIFSSLSISSGFNLHPPCLSPGYYGSTVEPGYLTVTKGAAAGFGLEVLACPGPTSYQWFLDGTLIHGATTRSFVISNVQPSDAGSYCAVIYSPYWGVRQSPVATLSVLLPPVIAAQPQPRTAERGSETRFLLRATGDPPLTCQWFFNGNVDLTGATTNSSLQLTNLQFSQSGAYTVVVSNLAGTVTSAPAMLSVIPVVPRRMVPNLLLTAEPATLLNIDYTAQVDPPDWQSFPTLYFTNSPQFYFDLSSPLPTKRFYRVWQTGAPATVPSVSLPGMVPGLTLTGAIGSKVKVEGINQIGPTDAWFTLDTVTLTETPQLYFDTSAIGQPTRLYRLSPVP